jgi:hypothetical protein
MHRSKVWLCCAAALMSGCNRIPEPAALEPQSAALQQPAAPAQPAPTSQPEPGAAAPSAEEPIKQREPEPGWSPLSLKDTLPICVFPNMVERVKAPFLQDVKPQKLAANSKLTFGVFGPGCLSDACDQRATLQCWTEQEGDTIVVKTRFSSFHKDGAECTENCLDLDTACDTQIALKPGKHTLRHGDKTYTLQVPGLVRDPCFGSKQK